MTLKRPNSNARLQINVPVMCDGIVRIVNNSKE